MTREEAIKRLEWLEMVAEYVDSVTIGSKCTEDWDAYNMAIAALREQDAADTNVGHKSNADHIRSMTDGELAEFLRNSFWGRKQNARLFSLKEWLKQPYKEAPMTPLEYMASQVVKHRLNHDRELARGAPEEQLHNIRLKIGYYEAACDALREQADNHVETD